MARDKLTEMGSMKSSEWIMLGVFILLLVLWIFGDSLGKLNSTTAAFVGLALLLVTGVLTWDDVEQERKAWDTLVWFAALVLGFYSNLFSSMTHYGTGPAPVFFGAGFVELGDWWKLGAMISVINILIWMIIGGLWWKLLGIW